MWQKATASAPGVTCVEVARSDDWVAVRDSKHPDGPMLRFTRAEWAAFLDGAKQQEFDHFLAG